MCFNHMWLTSW